MKSSIYSIKYVIRGFIPKAIIGRYHWVLAQCAARWYGYPSRSMVVIGVTGTNGKSTTVNMIGRILEESGKRVGWASTANYKVAEVEWLNDTKMTMLGRFATQRLLASMKKAQCSVAIIEMSSEGLAQYRHMGIDVDIAVFTNLTPEHIESHGGFAQYQAAKELLFAHLGKSAVKMVNGRAIKKAIISNLDDSAGVRMLRFGASAKVGYCVVDSISDAPPPQPPGVSRITGVLQSARIDGSVFAVDGCTITLSLPGVFNVSNAMAAIATTSVLSIPHSIAQSAFSKLTSVPGRMEWIDEGQAFVAMVDYAPEPASLAACYGFLSIVPYKRLIHVLGSAGGGRDESRRSILGQMAAAKANIVIITNEDPYDEDPQKIIDQVAQGARMVSEPTMTQLLTILDRGEAIRTAVDSAQEGDMILLTGKACEQAICIGNGQKIPWDDRTILREAIRAKVKADSL